MQDSEPLLASALHTNILAHKTLGKAMAHLLALKMSSRTLLGTQLMRLINDAYADEPVSMFCFKLRHEELVTQPLLAGGGAGAVSHLARFMPGRD